jgi:AcrR family transcriptional regulator
MARREATKPSRIRAPQRRPAVRFPLTKTAASPVDRTPAPQRSDDETTRERIKRAARRLFALNGVDAVSVRDVVKEAGAKNVSALNYYFGSKEGLIQTLIRDALAAANARWDEALKEREAAGGPQTIREVVEILVLRGLPPSAPEGDEASARFFATLLHTRRHLVTDTVVRLEFSAYDRALRHIRRLMPPMPDAARDQRLLFYFWASSSILAVLEGAVDDSRAYVKPWDSPDPLRNFVDAAVGMLEGPFSGDDGSRQAMGANKHS